MQPKLIPSHIEQFWKEFAASQQVDPTPRFVEAFTFDDNEQSANELAMLVLRGVKRGTSALVCAYEKSTARFPEVGDLCVITTWAREPLCVVETQQVEIAPFNEVTAEFAAIEGEGGGSLEHWRKSHQEFFGRECERLGCQFAPTILVLCERFSVVYRR